MTDPALATARKFMFETSFDLELPEEPSADGRAPDEAADIETEPEIPTFSEEDLTAAREESFKTGKEEGVRETQAGVEQLAANALQSIERQLAELFRAQQEAGTALAQDAVSVGAAITRKLFPAMANKNALEEIEHMILSAMRHIASEPRISIRTTEELAAPVAEHIKALADHSGFEGEIVVGVAQNLAPGDCLVSWENGGAERNSRQMWREIDEVLSRNLGDDWNDLSESLDSNQEEVPEAGPDGTADGAEETLSMETSNKEVSASAPEITDTAEPQEPAAGTDGGTDDPLDNGGNDG